MPSFFFNDTAPTEIYPLSLPDALPIWLAFACSPYDPDHISAPERVGDGPPRDSTHWLCLPRYSFKRMGTIYFSKQKDKENKSLEHESKLLKNINIKERLDLYIMRVPKLAGGPGRENQSTGSGGAPNFYKNWLGFVCSPNNPDHISAPERDGGGPPRDSTHWLCLPRYSFKRMGTIIFFNKMDNIFKKYN